MTLPTTPKQLIPRWLTNGFGWVWRNVNLLRLLRYAIFAWLGIWVWKNIYKEAPLEVISSKYGHSDATFVDVDGMQVYCRMVGKGDPVLLLHNANSSNHTWTAWADSLSSRYRVIIPDLPGNGLTGPHPRGSYSLFMYTGFVDSLAQALELKQFHLAGNGLGGQIAWFYAAEHPEKIKKLILLDPPGFEQIESNIWDKFARTPLLNRVAWYLTPPSLLRLRLEHIYSDDHLVTDSLVQRHFDLTIRAGNRKAYTDRAAVTENSPPVLDLIKKITAPTLVMWGAEDALISPSHAYEFHKKLRNGELRIYNNTGHWPQEESPGETASDALSFLNGTF
jgi:pimeloyl-ACP methyl ester carboxylesterase